MVQWNLITTSCFCSVTASDWMSCQCLLGHLNNTFCYNILINTPTLFCNWHLSLGYMDSRRTAISVYNMIYNMNWTTWYVTFYSCLSSLHNLIYKCNILGQCRLNWRIKFFCCCCFVSVTRVFCTVLGCVAQELTLGASVTKQWKLVASPLTVCVYMV